nr:site-specific integrase [uncultured Blautia sp.]
MPRKGENIRKRKDGRWEARYEKCRDINGRIQYGYLYGHTYDAVKKKKIDILCKNNPQKITGKQYIFRNLSQEWLLSIRYTVKISTYACYETLIETHIIPEFGNIPVKYISSASICTFSEKMKQKGLSPRTIKNLLILFHSILCYGEKQGYLSMSQIEIRYPKITDRSFNIISQENMEKLITVLLADTSKFSIGILLCIYTGIRVGELSGIRWSDVDFNKKILHIRRTISRVKNLDYTGESDKTPKTILMIGSPKSTSSLRDIPIPDFLLKKLETIEASPDAYLLTGSELKCMEPRNIQRKFQKLLKQCEIPNINIHSLRHAFATRCTEMGFDSKTLSEILGHSSVKITMDIYVHSSMKQKQKCMEKLYY